MAKIKKGEYGYRNRHRIVGAMILLIYVAIVVVQAVLSKVVDDIKLQVLFTVTAILSVLPMAKYAAIYIAGVKYSSPSYKEKEQIANICKDKIILYDMIFTTKEAVIPADYVVLSDKRCIIYISDNRADISDITSCLNRSFAADRYPTKTEAYVTLDDFIEAIQSIDSDENNDDYKSACDMLKGISL